MEEEMEWRARFMDRRKAVAIEYAKYNLLRYLPTTRSCAVFHALGGLRSTCASCSRAALNSISSICVCACSAARASACR